MLIAALLIFPCAAILWLLICDRLGHVEDEPPLDAAPDLAVPVAPPEHEAHGNPDLA